MRRVRFVTFGCKANQYDTQVLREALLRRGWSEQREDAELVVINTCTVTAEAGRKARQLARRLHREDPSTRIAMTGCLAESEPEILRELPGVEWVLGNGEAKRPVNFLRQLGEELDPEELGIPAGITRFAGRTRAFIKIQDGCDLACAYCIIPKVRGQSRSRSIPELEREVRALLSSGHRELVLCGIHIGHWGRDLGLSLADLVGHLASLEHLGSDGAPLEWRLRLSSIEATEVDGRLLDLLRQHPRRVAQHLHMPLQSGSSRVLKAMQRWYDASEYLAACDRLRACLDHPAFTADVLVGFPGEDEADFEQTLEAVREAGFARVHVFPFSARPGTPAAGLPNPVQPDQMRERRARLGELASALGREYRRGLAGLRDTVVLEGGAGLSGRYQRVRVPLDELPPGRLPDLVEVRLALEGGTQEDEAELVGRPLGSGVVA